MADPETSANDPTPDAELFAALYPGLRRFAAVVGAIDQEPDDLVQEAVAKTLRKGPIHRLEEPGAYLRRAILHLAADTRRSAARRTRALARLHADARAGSQAASDLSALELLGPVDRAVLYLVDVHGYGSRDAAEILGLSDTALRSRASRARRRLRDAVGEQERDSDTR